MIALLFNWRIWLAVSLAIFLAGTHWKAYHAGGVSARAELQAYQLEATQAAAAASEAARKKEGILNANNERIRRDLAKEKANRAADAAIAAGRLRDLESAIDSASSKDSATGPVVDDAPLAVARQCARQLILLDEYAQGLASQTRGLQAYAADVCRSE